MAPYQELLIRGVNFADGAAGQQGELQIFDDKGKLLKKDQL